MRKQREQREERLEENVRFIGQSHRRRMNIQAKQAIVAIASNLSSECHLRIL
jgi:hypothetical protein